MQYGARVTWCAGFSRSRPSSEPMKKLPPGTAVIPAGHEGATGAAAIEAAGGERGGVAVAAAAPLPPWKSARDAPSVTAAMTTPETTIAPTAIGGDTPRRGAGRTGALATVGSSEEVGAGTPADAGAGIDTAAAGTEE